MGHNAVTDSSTAGNGALDSPRLDALLLRFGVAGEFIEFSGNVAHTSATNRLQMLQCMGFNLQTSADVDALLSQREHLLRTQLLPSVYVLAPGQCELPLNFAAADPLLSLHWQLMLESGPTSAGSIEPAQLVPVMVSPDCPGQDLRRLPLGELSAGYYTLELTHGNVSSQTLLVVAPTQCWLPAALQEGKRLWGLSVQLYTVRTEHNCGIGDFADLLALTRMAAQAGAAFVLLNPLHYLDLRYPDNASPYSPSDRRFLNPLYVALSLSEDFLGPPLQAAFNDAASQHRLASLRADSYVDYAGIAAFKLPLLALMYKQFCLSAITAPRRQRYQEFCRTGGQALHDFAVMQASLGIRPEAEFADPGLHLYMQWLASDQLLLCQHSAVQLGMALGLVRDLAVGSSSDGSEVQNNRELFCDRARIGAPPDHFTPLGQNWGLPPIKPAVLVQQGFRHFIDLLQSNMRACGGLRIDHVMSLMRLWWCPQEGATADGAYVHYPVDVMFAILRLESMRNHCLVIGEDLGVVPPEIRGYLDPAQVYSNCVFYFEKYDGWHFRKPEHYKRQALAMIANHDVPPLASWWNRTDLRLRRKIGLAADDEKLQQETRYRQQEQQQLLQWLAEQQLLPAAWHDRDVERTLDADLTIALTQACGRTASLLLSLQLDDLAGADSPVNIPGTSNEYANWRRKLPHSLTEIFSDPRALSMLQVLARERP